MKELNSNRGLSFGFSTVNAGQRQVTYEPQVIATSTDGAFRTTPIISKLLNLQTGDNIAFINNIDNLDTAIRCHNEGLVAFCEEKGLDIDSPEAYLAIHKEFDMWGIFKGIQEYDAKGNPKTCTERLTKKDRANFVVKNFDSMMASALNSGDENLVAALNAEDVTEEKQVEILSRFVQPRELPKFTGSKVANPAGLNGTGVTLTFTDSNVWAQLKLDLGDMATKMNRIFDVDVNNIKDITVNNGYEDVVVKALFLGNYTDAAPVERIAVKK